MFLWLSYRDSFPIRSRFYSLVALLITENGTIQGSSRFRGKGGNRASMMLIFIRRCDDAIHSICLLSNELLRQIYK